MADLQVASRLSGNDPVVRRSKAKRPVARPLQPRGRNNRNAPFRQRRSFNQWCVAQIWAFQMLEMSPKGLVHVLQARHSRTRNPSSCRQRVQDCLQGLVGLAAHFIVRGVLDGMPDEDNLGILHSQRGRLHVGRVHELLGGNGNGGNSLDFKPNRVVQTARRTRASIGERLNNEIALLLDLQPQIIGTWLGKGRLCIASDLNSGQSGPKLFIEPIQKYVATRLANVEQTDNAGDLTATRCQLPFNWNTFVRRVQDRGHAEPLHANTGYLRSV